MRATIAPKNDDPSVVLDPVQPAAQAESAARSPAGERAAERPSRAERPADELRLRRTALVACGVAALTALASAGYALWLLGAEVEKENVAAAPAVMNLLANVMQERVNDSPEKLRRFLDDIARIPQIRACRITRGAAGGPGGKLVIDTGPISRVANCLHLSKSVILGDVEAEERDGPAGRLEIWFDVSAPASREALVGALAGSVGVCGAGGLAALLALFVHRGRRLRSLRHVCENVREFGTGRETAAELLAFQKQDESDALAEGWNGLVRAIGEIQNELGARQDIEAVARAMQTMGLQGFQPILDALPIGVVQIDADDHVTYLNYSAARLLRADRASGEGDAPAPRPISECVPDENVVSTVLALRGASDADRGRHGAGHVDVSPRNAAGAEGDSIVRLTPFPTDDDANGTLVVLVQDVSQQVEAERSRDAFLAHITHELRTPLTNIRAYAETLTAESFDDEETRRECYNVITKEARRLSRMIEDVLSVSQIESGASRFERADQRIDQMLRQAVQEMQAQADEREIQLSLRVPSKVPPVSGDRQRLHQVWINLLGNAIKYTPDGGTVSVTIQSDEHTVRALVTDSGIGIAPEHHQKVFEKFYRVPGVEDTADGTGLGLAITRDIVRMHGGTIRVESELGAGATFVVELPRARETVAVTA